MFRVVIRRTATTAARGSYLPKSAVVSHFIRCESNHTHPSKPTSTKEQLALKAARERTDDLQRDWDARILSYEELKPKTQNPTADTYLIDVREPDEVVQGMIPSAVNLPLSILANSLHLHHVAFKEKHGFEKPRKDQEIIFYCRSGVRSSSASDVAKRNGFTNILNYKGSWLEWVSNESKQQ